MARVLFGYVGKGESEWDYFWRKDENFIVDRSSPDVACDSYHLWKDDIDVLKQVGVRNF